MILPVEKLAIASEFGRNVINSASQFVAAGRFVRGQDPAQLAEHFDQASFGFGQVQRVDSFVTH